MIEVNFREELWLTLERFFDWSRCL